MAERDNSGNVVFEPQTMYKLSDLNQLELGVGGQAQKIIEGIRNYRDLQEAEKQMASLLGQYGFKNNEVYIEHGQASGETIETCFKNCSRNFQFADQFDI